MVNRPDVSVVVPVYGGAATITPLAEQLAAVFAERDWSWELLLICDRPVDGSWQVARELAERLPQVCAIRLRKNVGQHAALLLGIRQASGRICVTMDEDLQHSPADVPALVDAARDGDCLACGVAEVLQFGLFRNFSSRTTKAMLARFLSVEDAHKLSAFRAFPLEFRDAFASYRHPHVAMDVLLSWAGAPVQAVTTRQQPRAAGRSGYTLLRLVRHLGNLAFGFSIAPLRLASYLGLLSVLFAAAIAIFVIANWLLWGSVVPGFAFLAFSIAALGGAQLLALGLIGEYLGRLYFGALRPPQYQVAERVRGPRSAASETSEADNANRSDAESSGPESAASTAAHGESA